MKIKIWCNNGANIHSKREQTVDLSELGYDEEEWAALPEEDKWHEVDDWINCAGWREFGFEKIEGDED